MKYAIITTEFFNIDPGKPIPLGTIVSYHDAVILWSIIYQGMTWSYEHDALCINTGTPIKSFITFLDTNNRLVKLIHNFDKRNVLI